MRKILILTILFLSATFALQSNNYRLDKLGDVDKLASYEATNYTKNSFMSAKQMDVSDSGTARNSFVNKTSIFNEFTMGTKSSEGAHVVGLTLNTDFIIIGQSATIDIEINEELRTWRVRENGVTVDNIVYDNKHIYKLWSEQTIRRGNRLRASLGRCWE